jgi:hypothetical protein
MDGDDRVLREEPGAMTGGLIADSTIHGGVRFG